MYSIQVIPPVVSLNQKGPEELEMEKEKKKEKEEEKEKEREREDSIK